MLRMTPLGLCPAWLVGTGLSYTLLQPLLLSLPSDICLGRNVAVSPPWRHLSASLVHQSPPEHVVECEAKGFKAVGSQGA